MLLDRKLLCVLVVCITAFTGTPTFAENDCVICGCLEEYGNLVFSDNNEPIDAEKLLVESPHCMVTRLDADVQDKSPFVWIGNAMRKRLVDGSALTAPACHGQWNALIKATERASSSVCSAAVSGEVGDFGSELIGRCTDDQVITSQIYANPNAYAIPGAEACSDWPQPLMSQFIVLGRTDNVHFLEANGFPENWEELIGKTPALDHVLWLLVQHADNSSAFQKKALDIYSSLLLEHRGDPDIWVQLTDRVSINQEGKQIYGTHWRCVDGKAISSPDIIDSVNVDTIRAEVGLLPIAEFLADVTQKQCAYQE